MLLNGRVLLHSSAFIKNKKLFPICAEKGMGKSTLLAYAFKKGDKVFCDDTLPLILFNSGVFAINSTSFIKLNSDSCSKIGIDNFENLEKNVNNKAYVELESKNSLIPLEALYFMTSNNKETGLSPITSRIAAHTLVYGNIVGISWFNHALQDMVKNNDLFKILCSEIQLFKFNIIRRWDCLESNYSALTDNLN